MNQNFKPTRENIFTMDRKDFREIFLHDIAQIVTFGRIFHEGAAELSEDEKQELRDAFVRHGLTPPATDDEFDEVVIAVTNRMVTVR